MRHKITQGITLFISILLLCIGVYGLVPHLIDYFIGDKTYANLSQYAQTTIENPTLSTIDSIDSEQIPPTIEKPIFPTVDFTSLFTINPEVNGWILIEDTRVNYPTVQGIDNTYYLNRLFDHKKNASGSIFMDYENTKNFSDFHSIIYGHHMKNGSMFADIEKYKTQEFYDTHPTGKLITPDGNYLIHFISGYTANVKEDAWNLYFPDENAKQLWIESSIQKSDFKAQYTPTSQDTYITLSTCSYVFDNARYVLLGALEKIE